MSQAQTTTDRSTVLKNNYVREQLLADDQQRKALRANASLPDEAWSDIDNTVFPTMQRVLRVVEDLRGAGLTTTESMFNKTTEWPLLDDDHEASVDMTPESATDEHNVDYALDGAPVPVFHADFSLGFRDSGTDDDMTGGSLETLNAEAAARSVAEKMEDVVMDGWGPSIGTEGYTAYGLTNHPDAHTGSLSDWDTSPGDIRDDIRAMADDLKTDGFRPDASGYWLYVDESRYDNLEDIDPDGSGDLLVRDRVENLSFLDRIQWTSALDDGAVLFRPTTDVIDLAVAQEETTVQWEGPFRDHFKVMSIMTPRVKSTAQDECGIAYYN